MRKTALTLALTVALTAAAPLAAAPAREVQPRLRETTPNPIVRTVDTVVAKLKKIVRAFENPTLPHPVQ